MFDGEINYVFENLRLSPSTIGTRLRTLGASCGVHPLQGAVHRLGAGDLPRFHHGPLVKLHGMVIGQSWGIPVF